MKTRITTIIALLALAFTITAQKGNVNSADYELTLDKPDLEKAESKILEAEKNEKTSTYPKTYIVKQRVYREKYAKDNKASENLFTAFDAISKAEELNQKGDAKGKGIGKYTDEIKKDLFLLRVELQNCGANAYNAEDYDLSMKCFEKALAIDQMPSSIEEGATATIDTGMIFNTAICAYYSKNEEKTKEYMLQCIDYNYGGSTPHTVMYLNYKDAGDTVKMVEILKDGFVKFEDDATFLKELVIYFIGANDLEEGMKYINIALERDPENSSFWFTKGTFHDQSGEIDLAIDAYKKALETATNDDEVYNPNYNLAVIYYNIAVEAANKADEQFENIELSKKLGEEAKVMFRDCIPYFEACLEINPDDLETLNALRPVYYRLSDDPEIMKKYEALQEKVKILNELK